MTDQQWMNYRLEEAVWRPDRESCLQFALLKSTPGGFLAEFGVGKGETLNHIADMTDETVHGFDLFPRSLVGRGAAQRKRADSLVGHSLDRFALRWHRWKRWPSGSAGSGCRVVPSARPLRIAFRF